MAWRRIPRDVACTMLLGVGLSLNNTRAVLEGCMGDAGAWVRTPKTGDRDRQRAVTRGYPSSGRMMGAGELSLAAYFGSVAVFAWWFADRRAVPFLLLLLLGFAAVAFPSLARRRR
jgi:hypothetical protein